MTNEERFIASCESVGEADVRQKLNANRFSGQKAVWAGGWLELVESAKSDATKAEERSSGLRIAARTHRHSSFGVSTLLLFVLLAGAALFLMIR
ncbi:MAG: hypothetical protein ACJ8FT_09310 [Sphingomonas sp.]